MTTKLSPAQYRDRLVEMLIDEILDHHATQLQRPEREVRFMRDRKWQFDYAWVSRMVALELEGFGRHQLMYSGFERDCWKYSWAAALGWKVVRLTYAMLEKDPEQARALVEAALGV